MARRKDKEKAIQLRKKGWSYSQIKKELGIAKSTLSGWLHDYPLSEKRIRELRDKNPRRIERFRSTMRKKREEEFKKYLKKAGDKIGSLNDRELFIAGLFLYWGEGGKTQRYCVALSNTDPAMLKFFLKWCDLLGVEKSKLRAKLHIYKDMDDQEQKKFWSKELGIPLNQFVKTYVKKTNLSNISYKVGYGRGTCNVYFSDKELAYLVHMGLKYVGDLYR